MARFKRGDRVIVADREATPADRKSGLYYAHFAGLHGVVDQVYDQEGEVCVEIDQDTLPQGFEPRHLGIQNHVRQKWLSSISEAERRGLPEEQKALRLKYTILLSPDDLAPEGRGKRPKPAEQSAPAGDRGGSAGTVSGGASSPSVPAASSTPTAAAPPAPDAAAPPAPSAGLAPSRAASPAPRRLREEDLAAAEEAHLAELRRRAGK